ncbi:MAG: NDP-hexose 2,3-dehydratase family protein [Propionibacteriales bacterium]|nr:NDP-hexose 2,3-dehydratase family protein [Propionibacteriales bacterium]
MEHPSAPARTDPTGPGTLLEVDGSSPRDELLGWLAERAEARHMSVERTAFADLAHWSVDDVHGAIRHDSGRFFSVEGLSVSTNHGWQREWSQPILLQPEVGFLALLVREVDGVMHALVQAKIEPGNLGKAQLSPTVQATRSNVVGVHRGSAVRYIEHVNDATPGRVLLDVLQSEQGSWFLRKRNRNLVVEVTEDVEPHPDFRWTPLSVLRSALLVDNVVNMDLRSVISCLPTTGRLGPVRAADRAPAARWPALRRSLATGPRPRGELRRWVTDVRSQRELVQRLRPLSDTVTSGWVFGDDAIEHVDGKYFSVFGITVTASGREVASWSQPIVAAASPGLLALLVTEVDGVLLALVQMRTQAGGFEVAELAPTVHCQPANYADLPESAAPRYLDVVAAADPGSVLYDAWQSEEGGRFFRIQNRYVIVEVPSTFDASDSPDHRWVTLGEVGDLLARENYVTVELRTLMACALALAQEEHP